VDSPASLAGQILSLFTVASFNHIVDDVKKSFHFFKTHPFLSTSVPPIAGDDTPPDTLSKILAVLRIPQLADFAANPRFDDPAYLTTLAIGLAAVFVTMSWFSRSGGSWGGRFSPFGRPGNSPNAGVVNDSDFSYITNEDLRRNGTAPEVVEWDDKNPDRETDCVVFKEKRTNYPTHFPVHSIRDGDLRIGKLREAAARKLNVDDARRIRMFYKGRNLKHDERTAREEGLRGDNCEILVTVGEAPAGGLAPPGADDSAPRAWSDNNDDDDDDDDDSDGDSGANKKKSRKRGGRRSKKKTNAPSSGTSTPGYTTKGAGSEFLPIPSHMNAAPRPSSAPPQPARAAAAPATPQGKLDAIASKFHTEFVPMCVQYMANPPAEKSKREFEYKKLSETILTQIIFKLDGVETDGDQEARATRKALVKEVQGMLAKLDETAKKVNL
jgi:hypothetical protein